MGETPLYRGESRTEKGKEPTTPNLGMKSIFYIARARAQKKEGRRRRTSVGAGERPDRSRSDGENLPSGASVSTASEGTMEGDNRPTSSTRVFRGGPKTALRRTGLTFARHREKTCMVAERSSPRKRTAYLAAEKKRKPLLSNEGEKRTNVNLFRRPGCVDVKGRVYRSWGGRPLY